MLSSSTGFILLINHLIWSILDGKQSEWSVSQYAKQQITLSKITPDETIHTLPISFAPQSLEQGVDLRYIQELLGHTSSKTTEVYTHITKKGIGVLKSPIDFLDI
jgi:site-specific recombinase XerD